MLTRGVTARTPVRAADAGGWTDTWFAERGVVCAVAVGPAVETTVRVVDGRPGHVTLDVAVFGDRYAFSLDAPPGRHPLLEATLARYAPRDAALAIETTCQVPPGSGLGTSASVVVGLIAALEAHQLDTATIARRAHEIETVELEWQSGVQDQVMAAEGGAQRIDVEYPVARATRIEVPPATWDALAERLVTVYLGRPHRSSAVHEHVIASLRANDGALEPLRRAAVAAADALTHGDLAAYAAALTSATEGQRALHPDLVSPDADAVWRIACAHGSLGWKVNGAGGDGGTVTIVAGDDPTALRAALRRRWRVLDLRPTNVGLVVTTTTAR